MLRVDWARHFQPAPGATDAEPAEPEPCVFQDREHAILVYMQRASSEPPQKVIALGDRFLAHIHDRVGFDGEDRRQNGTDRPPELSPFGDVIDDEDESLGLEGWSLAEELKAWQEARQPTRKEAA